MKVSLAADGNLQTYKGINSKDQTISIGNGTAVSPMETLLLAAAGCSTIDVVMILEKMRQSLEDIKVEVEGTRRETTPRIFTKIHFHYVLTGDIKEDKAQKAIDSSLEKYCSVSLSLSDNIEISSSFEIQAAS